MADEMTCKDGFCQVNKDVPDKILKTFSLHLLKNSQRFPSHQRKRKIPQCASALFSTAMIIQMTSSARCTTYN